MHPIKNGTSVVIIIRQEPPPEPKAQHLLLIAVVVIDHVTLTLFGGVSLMLHQCFSNKKDHQNYLQ